MNPVHTFLLVSLRCIVILSSHPRLGLPSDHFPSGCPLETPERWVKEIGFVWGPAKNALGSRKLGFHPRETVD
jgi:hypothetical protein